MDPAVVLAQAKKTTGLFNFQGRAAIAEKHMAIKLAAKQRSEKSKNRATTPDHNSSATAHDTSATTKNVSLPSVGRIQNVTCKVKNLTLKLNAAEVSFPKVKEVGPNTAQKNVIPNTKARNARGKIFEGPIATRVTGAQPQKAPVGLHWKSSSGNIVSVDKPMFLTETEEQVSPSKNVFQNTLSKNREKNSTHAIQITAESLIVSASRLCLASHSTSHRTSNFWFNASIALAAISQDTLEPALRYFNRSIAEDINKGHVIAALIKALNDLSDAYQEFLFSWIEEQQALFVNARLRSQTDWFDDSLKLSYSHIEKLCFVANEVIAFLEEPQIPAESKFEQIQHDKKNLEDMLTLSHDFHRAEPQVMGSDIQDQIGRMTGKDKALVLEESSIYSAELGEVSLIEDEFEDNEDAVSCEEHVIEINIESKSGGKKASLVVAAARKYLKMKVQMRGIIKTGRKSVLPSVLSSATAIPASRVAYLHTCKALGVAPLPELFVSESFEEIDLRHYMLGLRGSIALSAGCCKFLNLKRLDLQHCMITVAGILLMSEAVANCSKLEYVNVGSCIPTSESGNCEEMGLAIINFTHSSKALRVTELILSNNSIIGIPIISWDSVQTGVNEHLTKLDLGQCNLGSAACIPLSRAIQKLVKLTSLNLRWNNFNGDAICKLLDVLAFHRHLFELDMSRNSCINNKSSVAIQTLLFNNMSLSSLNLSFCNIKPTHATIISAGYMTNQSLRKFYVEGNPLGPQGAVALFKISSSEYNEDARLMSLAGCNLDFNEADVDLFDFLHPSCENKAFRLVEEYDWACAFLLCAKRCECAQEIFKKANLDAVSWNIPGEIFDETMFPHESDTPEAMKEKLRFRTKQVTEQRRLVFANLPKTGVLTLSIEYSNPPNIMSDVIFANNIVIMSQTSLGDGGLMSKKCTHLQRTLCFKQSSSIIC
jgi:Ran GTPase-activating protein (RanGAP) involved in mRNA processing and transport